MLTFIIQGGMATWEMEARMRAILLAPTAFRWGAGMRRWRKISGTYSLMMLTLQQEHVASRTRSIVEMTVGGKATATKAGSCLRLMTISLIYATKLYSYFTLVLFYQIPKEKWMRRYELLEWMYSSPMVVNHWLGVAERMKGKVTSSQASNREVRIKNKATMVDIK